MAWARWRAHCPYRIYRPQPVAAGPLPALNFFHGGGGIFGGIDTHDGLCRVLSSDSGCVVISIGYRQAPEHKFPAAVEDSYAATLWIFAQAAELGLDPRRIAIGGDSAGGGLAAVVCRMAAANAGPRLALQLLFCPVMDLAAESPSRRAFAQGYFLDRTTIDWMIGHYCAPGTDLTDPRLSPLRGEDLLALPPAHIHTAEFDPLRDEGAAYAERLRRAGVATRYTCHAGMIHHFYGMAGAIPAARDRAERVRQRPRWSEALDAVPVPGAREPTAQAAVEPPRARAQGRMGNFPIETRQPVRDNLGRGRKRSQGAVRETMNFARLAIGRRRACVAVRRAGGGQAGHRRVGRRTCERHTGTDSGGHHAHSEGDHGQGRHLPLNWPAHPHLSVTSCPHQAGRFHSQGREAKPQAFRVEAAKPRMSAASRATLSRAAAPACGVVRRKRTRRYACLRAPRARYLHHGDEIPITSSSPGAIKCAGGQFREFAQR